MLGINFAFMVHRDFKAGVLDIDLLANQAIRHTVEAFVHRNMVIDTYLCFFTVGDGEALLGQSYQPMFLQTQKQLLTGFAILVHQAVVECFKLFGNGNIELFKAEEPPVPQRSQNASLYLQYAILNFRFILGLRPRAGSTATE